MKFVNIQWIKKSGRQLFDKGSTYGKSEVRFEKPSGWHTTISLDFITFLFQLKWTAHIK